MSRVTRLLTLSLCVAVLGIAVGASPSWAAREAYLVVNGQIQGVIQGDSTAKVAPNAIVVQAIGLGLSIPTSSTPGGGQTLGRASVEPFKIAKFPDKASPKLLLACASGQHIPEGLMTCRKAGKEQQEYLKVKFTDLLVSSFQTGGSNGDVIPVDQISLNFSKIEYEYCPQKPDGTLDAKVPVHWDLKQNKGG